jgi:DNA-binding response OmpR family regulator
VSLRRADGARRILVVDDDSSTRSLLREILTPEGYAVEEATDAATAMEKVATCAPDLLLLDVMMPGQDGLEFLANLRRSSDVSVILLTAKEAESDRGCGWEPTTT